ncbi:leucine rich adaptor protein 1 [Synchiropus picturatus]
MTTMEEASTSETVPDLKDVEAKIGRKTPEGLLRWMREEATAARGDVSVAKAEDSVKVTGRKSLDEKIRKLKVEMLHLRSVDVKILNQLLAVHEGIEAVKWLLEERSTLTSRCSSLTSSQYSLGDGPDTSWRGSWSSLHDPHDKLDNISIGSYLDTLADDMDEYCPSSSESVICSSTPQVSEATVGGRGAARTSSANMKAGMSENGIGDTTRLKVGPGTAIVNDVNGNGMSGTGIGKPVAPANADVVSDSKQNTVVWNKALDPVKGSVISKNNTQTQYIKPNGIVEKSVTQTGSPTRVCLEKLGTKQSPKLKHCKNGKIDLDTCKMNSKMQLEYDAHWRWVQSQEDVTFL